MIEGEDEEQLPPGSSARLDVAGHLIHLPTEQLDGVMMAVYFDHLLQP
jgi:hypothetical protein